MIMWLVVNPSKLGLSIDHICKSATEGSIDEFLMRSSPELKEELMPTVFHNEKDAKREAVFRLTLLAACPDVKFFQKEMRNRRNPGEELID